MSSVIYGKRMVLAKCKKCGRVYWYFSDVDDWNTFEKRLKDHLIFAHVRKGELTMDDVKNYRDWYDMTWYRVYDPTKINMPTKQFEALHPEFIKLQDYEQLKLLAHEYPPGFIKMVRDIFAARGL